MSQINIQSLLNQQPIGPSVAPIQPTPEFRQSQISGGQVKLGQAAQQVGPSSEEAMYSSLAQIAGGVESSINIFSKISEIEEKRKISNLEVEYDKLDQSDLTPEEKKEQLEKLLKDSWTPVMGDGWKEKIAVGADRRWLSEEGRNAYEEKRYRQRFVEFLNRPENLTRGDTPELEEIFQKQYTSQYPSAKYNNWFRIKTFETGSRLIQKKVQDAVSLFPLSVNSAIQVPNEEERKKILYGNDQLREKYKVFFDLEGIARLSPDTETFAKNIHGYLQENLINKLDPNTPIEVYQELARQLPGLALQKAQEIMAVSSDFRLSETQQEAVTSLELAKKNLETSNDKVSAIRFLLDNTARHLNTLDIPRAEKRTFVFGLVPVMTEQLDQAITQGTDQNIANMFPEWNNMTAVERVDVAIKLFDEWLNTGNNKQVVLDTLAFTPKELEGLGKTPEEAAERLVINNAKTMAYLSKPVQERLNQEIGRDLEEMSTVARTLGAYADPEDINKTVETSITKTAAKLGISVESLQKFYRTKDGWVEDPNVNSWFKTLSVEEQRQLIEKGFSLNNFDGVLKYLNAARDLEIAKFNELREKRFTPGSMFDVDKITKQADKFSPTITHTEGMVRPSIAVEVLSGRASNSAESREFIFLLHRYRTSRDSLKTNPRLSPLEKEELTGFVSSVESSFPFMSGYADAVDKGITEMIASVPAMVRQIPTPSASSPTEERSYIEIVQEFKQQSDRILTGQDRVDVVGQPAKIIDEDGTWTKEARYNLLHAAFMSKRAFAPDAREADKKLFNNTIDMALTRIAQGGPDYLRSPGGKYDLTLLATLGTTFKQEAARTGTTPQIHRADYFVRRAAILGNWANSTNVDQMLIKLNSPDSRAFIDANLRVPLALSALVRGDVNLAASYEQTGAFTKELVFRDKHAIRVASALGAQMIPYVVDDKLKLEIPGETINANSEKWSAEKLRSSLELALGTPVSMDQLASELSGLLTGFSQSEFEQMNSHQRVRAAVQVINSITQTNEGALRDIVAFTFGDFGLRNDQIQPLEGESKLQLFVSMLETGLGIQNRYNLNINNVDKKIGTTPTVPLVINRGSVSRVVNDVVTKTNVVEPNIVVYGSSYGTTFSGGPLMQANSSVHASTMPAKIMERLETTYPPAKLVDPNTGATGKANGLMYTLGALSLEAKVPNDLRARFSVVEEWAKQHGITRPEQFMLKTFSVNTPGIASPSAPSAARAALQKVLTKEDLSLKQMLEELNEAYLAGGGQTPLFNPTSYDPKKEGFAELVQNRTTFTSRESKLPTFQWSNRSPSGLPFIKLTDAYYYNEAAGGERLEARFLGIENYITKLREDISAKPDGMGYTPTKFLFEKVF